MNNGQTYKPEEKRRNNIGAFWQKISKKDGKPYWTGNIEIDGKKIEIIMFQNTDKQRETHPDLVIRKQEFKERPQQNYLEQ